MTHVAHERVDEGLDFRACRALRASGSPHAGLVGLVGQGSHALMKTSSLV